MDESNSPQSDYLLPGRVYDILKWLALIALPAVAWLVGAVGPQGDCHTAANSLRPSTRSVCSSVRSSA